MLNSVTHQSRVPIARRLVLVHGFTQNSAVWPQLVEHLVDRYQVICVDLPGHGETDAKYDESSLWETADLLTETCGPAIYVGYSLGARVLLHALLNDPDRVEAAVLIGTKAGFRDPDERAARTLADNLVADRIEALGDANLHEFMDDWLSQSFNDALSDEAKFRTARLRNRARGLAESLRHTGSGIQEPLWDQLDRISTPTLLMRGDHDLESVESEAEDMKVAIGDNASLAIAPNTGHAGPFENPALIADMIETWLA